MKRLIPVVISAWAAAAAWAAPGFAGCDWGSSPAHVREVYGDPAEVKEVNGTTRWGYDASFLGVPASYFFYFTRDGRLAKGGVTPHATDDLAPFLVWEESFRKELGPPQKLDRVYAPEDVGARARYAGDEAAREAGIRAGEFELCDHWEMEGTACFLTAVNGGGVVVVGMVSESATLGPQYDAEAGK